MRTMEWARRYEGAERVRCLVGTSIEILRMIVPVNGWFKERKEASDVIQEPEPNGSGFHGHGSFPWCAVPLEIGLKRK
jgi:hypothetical protein